MAVCIVVCMIVGYLFGCIQTGYIVGRVNKIDIRDYGSGNSGTTNTLRTLGKTAAIITFLGDAVKGLVAVNLARYVIMPAFHVEGEAYLWLLTGFAVVLGHNFPFYLGFKGGKGISCFAGVITCYFWPLAVVGLITFVLVAIITKYISVASTLGTLSLIIAYFIMQKSDMYLFIFLILTFILIIIKHIPNYKRLIHNEENKIKLFDKKSYKVS